MVHNFVFCALFTVQKYKFSVFPPKMAQNDSKTIRGLANNRISQMLDRRSHQGRSLRELGFGSNRGVAYRKCGNERDGDF